jgi:hypothetical protein
MISGILHLEGGLPSVRHASRVGFGERDLQSLQQTAMWAPPARKSLLPASFRPSLSSTAGTRGPPLGSGWNRGGAKPSGARVEGTPQGSIVSLMNATVRSRLHRRWAMYPMSITAVLLISAVAPTGRLITEALDGDSWGRWLLSRSSSRSCVDLNESCS